MLKNEKIIMNNYFGLSYLNQKKIYNLFIDTLDPEEDAHIIASLQSIFKTNIDSLEELYDACDKGLRLKSFYVERMANKKAISIDNFMNAKQFLTEEDYKMGFLFNINQFDEAIIAHLDKFFNVKYVDDIKANEFIDSYTRANNHQQRRFILELIKNYYIVAYLPEHYIPGVNNLNNDFDRLVLTLFGENTFERYDQLKPIQKVKFIKKYKYDIDEYYRLQMEHSDKDLKSRRLKKRKHSPNFNHR